MSIIDTLITNRTQADVDALQALYSKPKSMWTADEWNEFLLGNHRGAYNASDMNRVLDALDYLAERVTEFGYRKPEIKRPSITEVIPGTSKLPSGYTELEYIQSTGEQFVDTLVAHSSTSEFVLKADVSYDSVSESNQLMGFNGNSGNAIGIAKATWWELSSIASAVVGEKYSIEHSVNGTNWIRSVNGTTVTGTRTQYSFTTNLFLFAAMASATVSDMKYYCRCRLYSAQVLVDGETVRDFVPCLNPSNEVGLYDIVNGVFYGNAGTGYFLPGPVVSLPEGYTRLEHIESTGEQHIDTEFLPNQDTRVLMDAQMTAETTSTFYFGARTTAGYTNFNVLYTASGIRSDYGDYKDATTSETVTNRLLIDKNKNVCKIGGTTITQSEATFQGAFNLFLFASNDGGTAKYFGYEKVYLCLIYDNDVLTRLYTPVLDADGEVGLYDAITGAFFGNAGTGAFVAGDEQGSSDGNTPTQIIERDYWKNGDRPPVSELAEYLANVVRMREVIKLSDSVPAVPADISQRITIDDANNIEIILTAVESLLNRILLSWFYSGEVYSGEV